MTNSNIKYRPEIDGLRSIAVLSVILFHAGLAPFSGGFVGVDVFFVISGYLITTILINEQEKGSISIPNFYRRRAKRIIPVLFLVIMVTAPAAWLLLPPDELTSYFASIISTATFSSNFLFLQESGYWDTATALKPLIHTWSLAVEEQYYIIFPFIVMLAWRFGAALFSTIIVVLMGASLWYSQYSLADNPMLAFYMLPTRAWELFAGSITAIILRKKHIQDGAGVLQQTLSLAGLSMIVFAMATYTEETPFPGVTAIYPVLGTALIIVAAGKKTIVGKMLGSKPFVAIGLISYSAYLWHQPVLAFLSITNFGKVSLLETYSAIGGILVLSTLSYHLVEKPIRLGHSIFGKKPLTTTIIFSCVFIAASFIAYQGNGFPERLNAVYSAKARAIEAANAKTFTMDTAPNTNKPIILIVGDSYVFNWSVGLRENIDTNKYRVISVSYLGCFVDKNADVFFAKPIKPSNESNCRAFTDKLTDKNILSRIDKIFFTSHRPFSYPANLFRFHVLDYISKRSSNAPVYIFGNYFQFNPSKKQTCLTSMFISKRDASFCIDSAEYDGNEKTKSTIDTSGLSYKYVDIRKLLCGSDIKSCPHEINGVPFMLDTNHLTATFATFMVNNIVSNNRKYFSSIGLSEVFREN